MSDLNILLVDDDEINRLVATTFLRKWNVGVTIATNGKEALDFVASKKYQMIMMDLHMPEMDGYECTSRIRAMEDPYFKNIPIIVFSASYTIDSKRKAAEFGMTDFMNKPFRHEELLEKINTYAGGLPGSNNNNSTPAAASSLRPLKIDFDLHTDGDPVFKTELVQLLMENLAELRQSLTTAIKQNDPQAFLKTCHKVYTAISMLNDADLTHIVDKVRNTMRNSIDPTDKALLADAAILDNLGEAVWKSLEAELNSMKKDSSSQQ
ncbi:MAG TPA: response regulator [Cyclobacteriaceae bacterium]|nr:response regulator [Cyclobacteriaceae bacterium]